MIVKKKDIVKELAMRMGYSQRIAKDIVDVYEDIILETLSSATFEEDAEIQLALGFNLCSRRTPEREVRDPRDQSIVVTPEKNIPYAKFTYRFKEKINN